LSIGRKAQRAWPLALLSSQHSLQRCLRKRCTVPRKTVRYLLIIHRVVCFCKPASQRNLTVSACVVLAPQGCNPAFVKSEKLSVGVSTGLFPYPKDSFSVVFWSKSIDGTILQLSVPDMAGSLLLGWDASRSCFVLYVGTKVIAGTAPEYMFPAFDINDGKWHQIAVTWTSERGVVRLYVDAKLNFRDTGFQSGRTFAQPSDFKDPSVCVVVGAQVSVRVTARHVGTLLGFSQTYLFVCFSAQSCSNIAAGIKQFTGGLSNLQLWRRVLTPAEVAAIGADPVAARFVPGSSSSVMDPDLLMYLRPTEPDYQVNVWRDFTYYGNSVAFPLEQPLVVCPNAVVTYKPGKARLFVFFFLRSSCVFRQFSQCSSLLCDRHRSVLHDFPRPNISRFRFR
jgi:hypothetical protein